MKFVALLSGGKDSCYNIVHCHRNGHELVAAASLRPEEGKDEIDSYLYQTVGQDAIEFVARALDVPLYRKTISGTAVEMGNEYGSRNGSATTASGVNGDETEDLYTLLQTVKFRHPDIEGVSVGAILSTYQRVRVEHVCRRLGLTALCYLWHRDQRQLLAEMVSNNVHAILIKVAGIGLETKHLGKSLVQMQATLQKLNDQFGSHICGEGGEYETLTLDCAAFKHRIIVTETESVIHSDSAFATVAYLKIRSAHLIEKDMSDVPVMQFTNIPLDTAALNIRDAVRGVDLGTRTPSWSAGDYGGTITGVEENPVLPSITRRGEWVAVNSAQAPSTPFQSLQDEVEGCFGVLRDLLSQEGLDLTHIASINLSISDMDNFGAVNAVYSTMFGTSPPSRACVGVRLPLGTRVRVDCIAFDDSAVKETPSKRQALHVQGVSYWAPANIGPYSQAIQVDNRIFVSGQIGLIPASMTLPNPRSLADEIALSLQHIRRISTGLPNVHDGNWRGVYQGLVAWVVHELDIPAAKKGLVISEFREVPILIVVPAALPKGALVEMQAFLHTRQGRLTSNTEDGDVPARLAVDNQLALGNASDGYTIQIGGFQENPDAIAFIAIKGHGWTHLVSFVQNDIRTRKLLVSAISVRLFVRRQHLALARSTLPSLFPNLEPTLVPIQGIYTLDAEESWDAAIVLFCA